MGCGGAGARGRVSGRPMCHLGRGRAPGCRVAALGRRECGRPREGRGPVGLERGTPVFSLCWASRTSPRGARGTWCPRGLRSEGLCLHCRVGARLQTCAGEAGRAARAVCCSWAPRGGWRRHRRRRSVPLIPSSETDAVAEWGVSVLRVGQAFGLCSFGVGLCTSASVVLWGLRTHLEETFV